MREAAAELKVNLLEQVTTHLGIKHCRDGQPLG
jgi:hypothetical protein